MNKIIFIILLLFHVSLQSGEVDRAVNRIYNELKYLQNLYPQNTNYLYALAINNYVVGHVSAPNFGYLNSIGNPTASNVEDILSRQAGICGSAQECFFAIAVRFNLIVRKVFIIYPHPLGKNEIAGHCVIEVYYGNKWHFFDPTWGAFYRKPGDPHDEVLNLSEILDLSPEERKRCEISYPSLLWFQASLGFDSKYGAGLKYMEFPELTVHIDKYNGPQIYQRAILNDSKSEVINHKACESNS